MNNLHTRFREELLQKEQLNPVLRQQYKKEIQAMLEQKLSLPHRVAIIFIALVNLGLALMSCAAAFIFTQWNPVARFGAVLFALFFLSVSVFSAWTAKKGVVNPKTHPTVVSTAFWLFSIVLMIVLVVLQLKLDTLESLQILLDGIFGIIVAATYLIINTTRQSELKTREKLLELEYRIAELVEEKSEKSC